jgi:hypothetical protein
MGFVISLILIAFGAILTWAVHSTSGSVDVNVVGVILMIVGFVVFALSIVLWRSWWGVGFLEGGVYDEGAPAVRRRVYRPYTRRRTTTYVEDEPPPGP